jgi:hypothetical protein
VDGVVQVLDIRAVTPNTKWTLSEQRLHDCVNKFHLCLPVKPSIMPTAHQLQGDFFPES